MLPETSREAKSFTSGCIRRVHARLFLVTNVGIGGDPDPPTLAFLEKARETLQKSKGFSLCGTPKILGKERKNAQKNNGNRKNEKSKENEKSKDWRVRGVSQCTQGGAWIGGAWNSQISRAEIYFSGPELSSKITCLSG